MGMFPGPGVGAKGGGTDFSKYTVMPIPFFQTVSVAGSNGKSADVYSIVGEGFISGILAQANGLGAASVCLEIEVDGVAKLFSILGANSRSVRVTSAVNATNAENSFTSFASAEILPSLIPFKKNLKIYFRNGSSSALNVTVVLTGTVLLK